MRRRVTAVIVLGALFACSSGEQRAGAAAKPGGRRSPDRVLRVCADPAGLPYSNDKQQGFENRIAALVGKELHAKVEYTWWVHRRGFVRNTLDARACDVVMGVPVGLSSVLTTAPYYRSTFAFLTRRASDLGDLESMDDPRLGALRIGVQLAGDTGANPPPVLALGRRGLTGALRGFPLYGELNRDRPLAGDALAENEIDVAILWGPWAGFAAERSAVPLRVVPLAATTDDDLPLTFSIAMGVRKDDEARAAELNAVIHRKRVEIEALLRAAGVPLVSIPDLPETNVLSEERTTRVKP
jgi:mxaJ protein